MTDRLTTAIAAIDAANAADPQLEDGQPAAQLYGVRMSAELGRLCPNASEILQIAARGQHIERWKLPRTAYPEGRAGYLEWRKEQGRRHGTRVAEVLAEAGYTQQEQDRVGILLRKEGIKRDAEVQMLEDVICFTFLKWYFQPFAETKSAEALEKIVARTARKMSASGRARVLKEFDLPESFAAAFKA
jgi:hypothetical protein